MGKTVNYFLAKSEPDVYSIDRLRADHETVWDGVRNAQAVRTIRSMRKGDRIFIYHSGGVSAIVGLAEVVSDPVDDPNDTKSAIVRIRYLSHLEPPVGLSEVKADPRFADWALVRQSRLSTMACPVEFVRWMKKRFPDAGL
jgi:predicted RNA-binding protein with PUA-like domain